MALLPLTPRAWLDRFVIDTVVPARSLRLAVRLLGLAALIKGIDLHLDLPSSLIAAGQSPLLPGISPPPRAAAPWISGLWIVSAALLTFRVVPRLAAATISVLGLWLVCSSGRLYGNHLYLLALLCLLASLADAGRGGRDPELVAAWPARLMQVQLSLVYGFGALAKLNGSFLGGHVLAANARLPESMSHPGLLVAASLAAVLVEAFLAVALWSSTWRPCAWVLGIGLHVGILVGLPVELDLIAFAIACLSLYPLFGRVTPAQERRMVGSA